MSEAREERQMVELCCSGSDPSRGNVAAIKRRFHCSIKRAAMRFGSSVHPPDAIFGNQLQSLWIA